MCSRLQLSLALLSIALAVLSVSSDPTDNRNREILQRAMAATGGGGEAEIAEYFLLSEQENAKKEAQSDIVKRNFKGTKSKKRKQTKKYSKRKPRK